MKKYSFARLLAGCILIMFGCNTIKEKPAGPLDSVSYKLEMETWNMNRVEKLKADDGWLNLAGLYWLKEGMNTFGSGDRNDIVFPKGKIQDRAGYFLVNQGTVSISVAPNVHITHGGKPLLNGIIFSPDSTSNLTLEAGSLRWFIIQRNKMVGIRLRDLESKEVQKFKGIEHYSIDPAWRVEASVEFSVEPKTIDITNVLGQTTPQVSPGTLVFTINGKEYRLDALEEGKNELFIIFGDLTNVKDTYPSGRYVYVNRPDTNGKTILDFNKAQNPPCAFTSFATCPLPPKQNVLNIAITAGEKKYSGSAHESDN